MRAFAVQQDASSKDILTLCDTLRDEELVPLGVALDDQEGGVTTSSSCATSHTTLDGRALIKFVSPETLIKARNEKRAIIAEKAAKKEANAAAEREKKRQQIEKGKTAPSELFKGPDTEYGSWDEQGIPLTMKDGTELSKSAAKGAKKAFEQQVKRHAEYLRWIDEESKKS